MLGGNIISGGNLPNIDYGNIAGQIFAQQPRDLGNLGVDLNANKDALDALVDAGLVDLGSMGIMGGMSSIGGSAPAITEQAQINAAQDYIDAVAAYMDKTRPQTEAKVALDAAKQALVDLGVSRNQIESVTNYKFTEGIDASRGISGVMGSTVGGALGSAADALVDKYGTGALKALDAYTSLFGYDADDLLKDTSVGFNPLAPGATYIFGEDGKVRTTPLGTTSAGNPVVLTGPIGAAGSVIGDLVGGDIGIAGIPGAAIEAMGGIGGAAQAAAGALNVADDTQTKDKVTLDTTGALGSATSDSDGSSEVKTTDTPTKRQPDVDVGGDTKNVNVDPEGLGRTNTDVVTKVLKDAPSTYVADTPTKVLKDAPNTYVKDIAPIKTKVEPKVKEKDIASIKTKVEPKVKDITPIKTGLEQDLDVAEVIRTNAGTDVNVPAKTSEPVKTSTPPAGGGSSSGGSDLPAGGGTTTVGGGPGDLVDIKYLYDMLGGLDQPFLPTEEEDAVEYVYAKSGGMIRNTPDLQQLLRLIKGR